MYAISPSREDDSTTPTDSPTVLPSSDAQPITPLPGVPAPTPDTAPVPQPVPIPNPAIVALEERVKQLEAEKGKLAEETRQENERYQQNTLLPAFVKQLELVRDSTTYKSVDPNANFPPIAEAKYGPKSHFLAESAGLDKFVVVINGGAQVKYENVSARLPKGDLASRAVYNSKFMSELVKEGLGNTTVSTYDTIFWLVSLTQRIDYDPNDRHLNDPVTTASYNSGSLDDKIVFAAALAAAAKIPSAVLRMNNPATGVPDNYLLLGIPLAEVYDTDALSLITGGQSTASAAPLEAWVNEDLDLRYQVFLQPTDRAGKVVNPDIGYFIWDVGDSSSPHPEGIPSDRLRTPKMVIGLKQN
ncbi:MAG: hypothetical protein Q7S65_02615 [Nanoarchaeota archaeon]|nr:hypothetical protein [Nanoarchaeota archaeon]